MTRTGYTRRQKILQNRLMITHLPKVYAALQSQVYDTAKVVQSSGIHDAHDALVKTPYVNEKLAGVIRNLYQDAGNRAAETFRMEKSLVIPISGFVRDVISFFNAFLLDKVVLPISRSMTLQIQAVLKQAISDGWGVDKTVAALKDSEITKRRAKTIVRTESIAAMNYAQLKAADNKIYQVEKTWIATEDRRTRRFSTTGGKADHTHAGVDGETRDLFDHFSNKLLFPGDKSGGAEEVINCRCTMSYAIKRDLSGNPLRKVPLRAMVNA